MRAKAHLSVTSTASWALPKQGKSWARTSMRLPSLALTPMFMSRKNALNLTLAPASRQTLPEHVKGLHVSAACLCADTLLCVSPMDPEDSGSRCTLSHRSGEATGAFPKAWSGTGEGESRTLVPWERKRALLQHCVQSGTEDVRDKWLDGLTVSGSS